MNHIKELDSLISSNPNKPCRDYGVSGVFARAYLGSVEGNHQNQHINIEDCIWDDEVPVIAENCRRFGIDEFTISTGYSGLVKTTYLFQACGVEIAGTTIVYTGRDEMKRSGGKDRYVLVPETAPALIMKVRKVEAK